MRYTQKIYNDLVKKIRKDYGISVKHVNDWWTVSKSNCHSPAIQSLIIGKRGAKYAVIAALAHELGHCLTVREGKSVGFKLMLLSRLGAPLSKKQKASVLQEEKNAWNYGFKFLRRNGVSIDDDMQWLKKVCLKTHSDKLKK